jgi:signal transduction histidine kinase
MRSSVSIATVSLVLVLLAGLAVLQFHWQRQVSDATREKMQKRVDLDTNRFAEDFNREIQAAYFSFQTDAGSFTANGEPSEFNERYGYWLSKTAYPELVKDFYYFENHADAPTLRFDRETRKFIDVEPPEEINSLRGRLFADKDVRAVYEDAFALVLPIHREDRHIERIMLRERAKEMPIVRVPEKFGNLVVLLDRETVTGRILADLVQKYFSDGDFKVSVADKGGQMVFGSTDGADAAASLLNLAPDKFIMFAGRDALSHLEAARKRGLVMNQRIETFSRTEKRTLESPDATYDIQVQRSAEQPRSQIFTAAQSPDDPWRLNVQHQSGSVATFIDNAFRRNVVIGASIFALLAAAILGIFFSAQRAKKFAQRQVDFVSSVSHEFRTPLAVIYSAGENLADGVAADTAHVKRYGRLIKGEGRKLSAMVEQILEFAGAGSGKQKYNFATTSVTDVINDALNECWPLIESSEIHVEKNVQDRLPTVTGDGVALSRAVQNLIANAVKYSNGSKWLRVSAANGGKTVKISVEDKGIGVESRDLRHIFEPFYRAKSVVDAQIHGNGLGLSLVKQIAEAHGGKITATSEPGRGSTFTIEVPQK